MRNIPALTRDQMVEIDRLMVEEAHISLLQMMENAGRALAEFVIDRYRPTRVTLFVGRGGNGGGGLVAARHLSNRGITVDVVTSAPLHGYVGVPAHQIRALTVTAARFTTHSPAAPDVIIDSLIGYSLSGPPKGRVLDLIVSMTRTDTPIVALDVPSGVDSTSGECPGASVKATSTLTLALPKTGLALSPNTGSLHLADISVPAALYRRIGIEVAADMFADAQIIDLP